MKFAINPLISSTSQLKNIDEDEYQQIINARKRVFDILFFEEKFAYVIDNFYELEKLNITVKIKIQSLVLKFLRKMKQEM